MHVRPHLRISILFLFGLPACDGGDPSETSSIAEVRITAAADSLFVGDSRQFTAGAFDGKGRALGNLPISWTSSDSTVVSVNATGLVAAHSPGTAAITAQASSFKGSANVRVRLPAQAPPPPSPSTIHTGTIASQTWRAADGPHFIRDTLTVNGLLTIEAGTVVYAERNALVWVGGSAGQSVISAGIWAQGTTQRPIIITAADTARGWQGILGTGFLTSDVVTFNFAHVLMSYGGLTLGVRTSADIQDSRFTRGSVLTLFSCCGEGALSMKRSVVEFGNIAIAHGTLEDDTVRSGRVLVSSKDALPAITINGGSIETNPGPDAALGVSDLRAPLQFTRPMRITGSRGPIVAMPLSLFQQLFPTRASLDSLRNNPNDTLRITAEQTVLAGTRPTGKGANLTLLKGFSWDVQSPGFQVTALLLDTLRIEAGAKARVDAPIYVQAQLLAEGTASDSISISSRVTPPSGPPQTGLIQLVGTATQASRLAFARITNTHIDAREQHALSVTAIRTSGPVTLAARGSTIASSDINGVTDFHSGFVSPQAALVLAAPGVTAQRVSVRNSGGAGVRIDSTGVILQDCTVAQNAGDGVLVRSAGGAQIRNCNLEQNAGYGVNNQSTASVDARFNWWGDAAGPTGPAGDGVLGAVDFSSFLPSRISFP